MLVVFKNTLCKDILTCISERCEPGGLTHRHFVNLGISLLLAFDPYRIEVLWIGMPITIRRKTSRHQKGFHAIKY